MAYREKTFNANVLTDLLGTYLTHKSDEREKYYKAAEKASKPQLRAVGGNLVNVYQDGSVETVYEGPVEEKPEKSPVFKEFTKDGTTYQGQFMGSNYKQTLEDIELGLPKGFGYTGFNKIAPNQPVKGKTSENYDAINAIVTDEIRELRSTQRSRRNIYGDELKATWDENRDRPKLNYFLSVRKNLQDWIKNNPGKQPIYEEGIGVYKPSKKKDKKVEVKNEPGSFWK